MKKRVDIKTDKRFKERLDRQLRIDKLYTRFKRSLKISWPDAREAYIKAIGSNNSFLVVVPLLDDDGHRPLGGSHFMVGWATTGSTINDTIKSVVLSALVLCADDEIEKVKEVDMIPSAFEAIVEHRGVNFFENLGPKLKATVQGAMVDVANPFHKV